MHIIITYVPVYYICIKGDPIANIHFLLIQVTQGKGCDVYIYLLVVSSNFPTSTASIIIHAA